MLGWSYGSFIFQLPVRSVPIITKVVGSNTIHGEVYSIQHYVIKFVSDLRHIGSFLRGVKDHKPTQTIHDDAWEKRLIK
jgi:hypothetical protein